MNSMYQWQTQAEDAHYLVIRLGQRKVSFTYAGKCINLRRTGSLTALVELLLHPYRQIRAGDLYRLSHTGSQPEKGQTGRVNETLPIPWADMETIRQIKRRLVSLNERIAELENWHDYARLDELREEREQLIQSLATYLLPNGKLRTSPTQNRKCYQTLAHGITRLLRLLTTRMPDLSTSLQASLQLGNTMVYLPPEHLQVIVIESGEKN